MSTGFLSGFVKILYAVNQVECVLEVMAAIILGSAPKTNKIA